MEPWLIALLVVAVLIVVAFAAGWLRRLVVRMGDQEVEAEAPSGGKLRVVRSIFRKSKVKGRGSDIDFTDTRSNDSKFDIK